jgi:metal transporter CNNM
MDGADEHSADMVHDIRSKKIRNEYTESSYTQNSRGGFHGADDSGIENILVMPPEELAAFRQAPPPTPNPDLKNYSNLAEGSSLPTRKEPSPLLPGDWNPFSRRYVSAMPVLPSVRRVTPFSSQDCSSNELIMPNPLNLLERLRTDKEDSGAHDGTLLKHDRSQPITPTHSNPAERFGPDVSDINFTNPVEFESVLEGVERYLAGDSSGDTVSMSSCFNGNTYESDSDTPIIQSSANDLDPVATETYDGFPAELLNQTRQNRLPDFASQTLPRTMSTTFDGSNDEELAREGSFHDDRALLPSQRRAFNGSASLNMGGLRSRSFWF